MNIDLVHLNIETERDVITIRKRAREIAARIGFGMQDQARIATATSEIAQNAFSHAGSGQVAFSVQSDQQSSQLVVLVTDKGPGIAHLDAVIGSAHEPGERLGVGIVGAQRLMDSCDVDTVVGRGTAVTLTKVLPRGIMLDQAQITALQQELAETKSAAAYEEDLLQSKELLHTLAELRSRQEELVALTRELEDTNRGVVALYAEIEEKAEHLRRADAMKSRFLSNTSHELRTPLSSIRALSQLLLDRIDGELTEAQEKQVLFIQKAANDLSDLVNDLLDLAKIEAGKVEIKPVQFTADELFSTLRGMLRPLSSGQAVDLVFEDLSGNTVLFTDEGKVSQILRNLISNALKFTEKGEVRVKAASKPGTPMIDFIVSDTGIGIAESNLQMIFEEFSQVENPLQKRIKGTGLGLPLCRKLAGLLGGTVEVQSTLGAGSAFTLSIPVSCPVAENSGGTSAQPASWSPS